MRIVQQIVARFFQSHSQIARYAVALASVLIVLAFRSLLHPLLGSRSQYIVFLLSVMFTAWYSGSMPALLALALGAFLGNTFFAEPYYTLKLEGLNDTIAIFTYVLIGVIIIYLFEAIKRREAKLTAQIVKQSEVENALRLSEERFRLATEAMQGVIYDWDSTSDIAYRSPGLYATLGYQLDEIQNNRKWWQSHIHPDDFDHVQQAHQKSVAQRSPTHSVEYRVRHKDGHYIWVWDNSHIIYNAQGDVTRLIGTTISIDERKRLAQSLNQTEERFRVAFQNASDAMVLSNENGVVMAANEAYCRLYGYMAEEVIGNNFEIIFPEQYRQKARDEYQQVFKNPEQLPFSESIVTMKNGMKRTVEARAGFVELNGQRVYMLSVIRDLTERKQIERELYVRYQLTANLAQANSVEDVGRITVEHLMNYLEAQVGNIFVYRPESNIFEMLYVNESPYKERYDRWQQFPASEGYPLTDVVKNNKTLWFYSLKEWVEAYPMMKNVSSPELGASVHLPLIAASETFGALSLGFSEPRLFTDSEKEVVTSMVFQAAQAIERARLAEHSRELAVMHERQRLARDLHDNVSQLLFSSSVISEMLPRLWSNQPEKALQLADQLNLMVHGAMAEMRTLLWELRPESIIQTQLSSLLTQLSHAIRARQETEISVTIRAENEYILPSNVQVGFYRIAQESVHNVIKHSHAAEISILMRQTPEYTALIVMDDGQGFDTTATAEGFGLRNMQERATSIGAHLSIKSQIGKGTRMRLLWMNSPRPDADQPEIKNPDATPQT